MSRRAGNRWRKNKNIFAPPMPTLRNIGGIMIMAPVRVAGKIEHTKRFDDIRREIMNRRRRRKNRKLRSSSEEITGVLQEIRAERRGSRKTCRNENRAKKIDAV